jgi:hypothetical protein
MSFSSSCSFYFFFHPLFYTAVITISLIFVLFRSHSHFSGASHGRLIASTTVYGVRTIRDGLKVGKV